MLGDRADVLTREEAVLRGWFGGLDAQVRPRLGDVVVACRDDAAVISTSQFAYEATLVGLHGSLTPAEMLIPMVVCETPPARGLGALGVTRWIRRTA